MEAYTGFASVYDIFMDNTPYEEWAEFVASLIKRYGISRPVRGKDGAGEILRKAPDTDCGEASNRKTEPVDSDFGTEDELLASERDLVVDLGCGTGVLTELLFRMGYDMIGVDHSQEMLEAALSRKAESGSEILYLCQDMRELELYSTVGTVISVCDCVNYLLEDEDVERTFSLVNNYLYPGGLFIFDFNTVYKYGQVIGDTTIAENREECSFIWENYYHEEERVNEYDLTVFVREEKSGLFRRFTETHFQRGYTPQEMTGFVEKAGMRVVCVLDADTHREVGPESERVYVVARECRKKP